MALPAVGSAISISQIQTEYGGSNPASLSEYYGQGNAPSSGAITMSADFGGTQAETVISSSAQQITVSSYISSGETLRIGSGVYIWSDSTSTAGMVINIPCTIINDGYIIGKGGAGNGYNGGPAINVTTSGVTIINNSGAFIAGGGGGGGRGRNGTGGGGAGGGAGHGPGGAGGSIGNSGASGSGTGSGAGGGAGGGGSATTFSGGQGGGGGGRGWYPTSSAWPGGSGGAAITGTSRTLTNNGTVYGST